MGQHPVELFQWGQSVIQKILNKKKKKEESAVLAAISSMQQQIELRFNEISSQVKELELGLVQLETKLLTKDLKDKQAYGLIHYKLHEAKHDKLAEEINDLEVALKRRPVPKDQ